MEKRGPRFKSMLLERRIPFREKKEHFEELITTRKALINDLRRNLKRGKTGLGELTDKISKLEDEIKSISYEE